MFDGEAKCKGKRKHIIQYHEICKKGKLFVEFHTPFKELFKDKTKFVQYFRMASKKIVNVVAHRRGQKCNASHQCQNTPRKQ